MSKKSLFAFLFTVVTPLPPFVLMDSPWYMLLDEMIAEIARFLIVPNDYYALMQVNKHTASLLRRHALYVPMYARYFRFYRLIQNSPLRLSGIESTLQTAELCSLAVRKDYEALKFVAREQWTPELLRLAVQVNPRALHFIPRSRWLPEFHILARGIGFF